MRLIVYKNSFKKELVLMQRRGKNIEEIKKVISALQQDIPLAEKNKDHTLSGDWVGFRECHIRPDWLLIYRKSDAENKEGILYLEATGTHSDLF